MPSDDPDDLIKDQEGTLTHSAGRASPYTAATRKPKEDKLKTLQPEGEKEITEPDQNPKPRIRKDLFLLENQIPYEVLDDIMTSAAKGGANMRNLIDKFIDQTVRDIRGSPLTSPSPTSTSPQQQQPPPAHLLQLLRNRLVGDHDHHKTNEKTKTGKRVGRVNELKSAGIQLKSGTEAILVMSFSSRLGAPA
ncbi:hypothetical protein Q3G72_007241 [Acer saccharum]|nr:hypothetical protein Q3G72_007241 [Acer saccharum]